MPNISQTFGRAEFNILAPLEYQSITGDLNSTQEERIQRLWLVAGYFRKWRIKLANPVPGGQSLTFTLRINEADTSCAVAFGPGDQQLTFSGADVAVGVENRVNVKVDMTGPAFNSGPEWNLEFDPVTGSKSCYGHNQADGTANTPIYYGTFCGFSNAGSHLFLSTVIGVAPCAGTITDLGVCLHEGHAGTHVWTIYKSTNGGTTFLAQDGTAGRPDTRATLSGRTARSSFVLSVDAGDLFYIQYDRTSGAAVNVYGGVSIAFNPTHAGEFIIPGLSKDNLNNVATSYLEGAGGQGGVGSVSPIVALTGVTAVNLRDLYVYVDVAPGEGNSWCFDYTENASLFPSNGSPFVTIAGADKTGHDTRSSHWIRLQNGETFTLRQIPTASPVATVMTWAAVGKSGSVPVVAPTGCGCDGCPEAAPPPTRGNIGPIAWLDTSRLQP